MDFSLHTVKCISYNLVPLEAIALLNCIILIHKLRTVD